MKRQRFALAISCALLVFLPSTAHAVTKAGATCKKLNSTSTVSGLKYTCIKSGKKLVWSKGVKVPAKPTPKPSVSASTGSTSIKVSVSKRVMTIVAVGSRTGLKVTINGVVAMIGKNTVKSGNRTVLATVGTKVIYMKTFKIK